MFARCAFVLAVLLAVAVPALGADPAPEQIMEKSFAVYGGDDAVATLTFVFRQAGGEERKLVYDMAWKKYDQGDVTFKAIFFSTFPPDKRGQSYMGWFYRPSAHKEGEEWLYLPELRTVRKLSHAGHGHGDKEADDFSKSLLQDAELMPRPPAADTHRLLRKEPIEGREYYVIESVPKAAAGGMEGMEGMEGMDMDGGMQMGTTDSERDNKYVKTIRWIDAETYLLKRVDYVNAAGEALKRQFIDWKQIGKAWVWEKVAAVDLRTHDETILELSDVRINRGLDDQVFSQRTMRLGLSSAVR